jgi:hypothetical protein
VLPEGQTEETSFSFSKAVPQPTERREGERHIKILRVGVLILDGRRELCLIRNISAGGLMAHVYSSVQPEQPVTVELKSNQQVTGRIVWTREPNAGIAFDSPVDIAELLANPPVLDNGWRARAPRVEVDRPGTLRTGAQTHWVRTIDISQRGVKLATDQQIGIGSEIVLRLEDFRPIAGVVRWQAERSCGIAFNETIPFSELVDWLKRKS